MQVTVVTEVEIERTVVVTEIVEIPVTRVVTATPTTPPDPTLTPRPDSALDLIEGAFAANYVAVQDQGNVEIELVRVLCEDAQSFLARETGRGVSESRLSKFEQSATACMLTLRVSNNTNGLISIYPDQGQVIVNGEQIEPWDFSAGLGPPFEDVSGDIYDGVTRIGGFWFGVLRSSVEEIQYITYIVKPPIDENWNRIGNEYRFEIDTTGWGFEPIPDNIP